ncbi:MAG: glycosyltransferase [Bacilli bacterium]|jgi:putative colanic acid biosynthesis glycosyltransferase
MKVLLIDVNCKRSSTGKIVYDLYQELNKNNIEAHIAYGRGPKIKEKNIYKFGLDLETIFHMIMTRLTGLTGIYSPFSTFRLIRYIKRIKPDVVHIHELHAYFVNLKPLIKYLKKKNIKVIHTFHCEFMYTGKCGHAYECEKFKALCFKCPRLKEYPKSLFFDFTKRMYKQKIKMYEGFDNLTIVTPSKWLLERVKTSFLKDKKMLVINNGIDVNIFKEYDTKEIKEKHNLKDEFIVLAVAPNLMSKEKGGPEVLKLAESLKEKDIKFIMIGLDEPEKVNLDNVIALPRTANQIELAKYYSLANVFVMLSEKENFPTTCIESIACGTPVIGYDVGGAKETAPKGCGEFVPYGDIKKIKELILKEKQEKIFKEKDECVLLGKTLYSKEKMFKEYFKLYKN